ncbi:MAG: DNA polymerase II large subunit, partial [Thermoplasmata archaeon]
MALSGVKLRDKAPMRIGARMGRPEKAKERKMKPPPHVLFPLGQAGGMQRLVNEAMKNKKITVEVGHRICSSCGEKRYMPFCECGGHTKPIPLDKPSAESIDISEIVHNALARLGETSLPEIKGVQGLVSREKVPEALEKGILRAKHEVYTFKDGTIRFDMTDVPLTHFKPYEISLSVKKAIELGYTHDIYGKPLEREDQILELKVQDFIPSRSCGEYFVRAAQYIDDLLVRFYNLPAFYNAKTPEDLIGHLAIGLAPHTSAGVVTRIIGYTTSSVGYAHPYFHAAKRRNCVHPSTRIPVWDEKRKELILPRIGKLVDGISPDGEIIPVPEGYDWYVFSLDVQTGEYVKRRVKHFIRTAAPKKWIRISTESGREFIMTPDHHFMHFFRHFEHKYAEDARKGDRVALCRKLTVDKVEREGWVNLARILLRL